MGRAKELHVKALADGIFESFLDGIVASNIKHIIDKEEEAKPLIVFVIEDKIGWFRLGLDESLRVEPFREFNVPVFA